MRNVSPAILVDTNVLVYANPFDAAFDLDALSGGP